jgi:hypothetical protein
MNQPSKIIDPRTIPGGLDLSKPGGALPQPPSPLAQLAMAYGSLSKAHNVLAQKMQIMAAQQQTLVEMMKIKTGMTDEELGAKFREVATGLGFTIVDEEESPDGTPDPEADSTEPDGGTDSTLPDGEQDCCTAEGGCDQPGCDDGGAA